MGVRMHIVYFDLNPAKSEILFSLSEISGQELVIQQIAEHCHIIGLKNQKADIEVEWINKRRGYDSSLKDVVGKNYVYPFPDKTQCIRVFTELANSDYLEITLLHLLKQAGGELENDVELPSWVGQSWGARPKKWRS
jgi:hypothetical protein